MRLRFKVQRYQTEAVDAVAGCFAGQPHRDDPGANAEIALSPARLLANIQAGQRAGGLPVSAALARSAAATRPDTPNLDVEMETGTGKTYVYIKTIMELNKRYGWSRFVVVVPSIAIREGVRRSFEVTAEHFQQTYGSKPRSFCYSAARLPELARFAADAGVQVMIINIQAFNVSGQDSRRIYEVLDAFQSRRPIDVISASRPVVIIDEPQKIGSVKSLAALSRLSPLMVLRYSATHRVAHDRVHRLDALAAYNQQLVKKIAVRGITVRQLAGTAAYLYLDAVEVAGGARPRARAELEVRTGSGIRRQLRMLTAGASLHAVSGGIEAYRGLFVTGIDASRNVIELSSGDIISAGQVTEDVTEATRRRLQIREVIRAHLDKERQLFTAGIKVLSLLFIDEVARYRDYSRADTRGEYARVFTEEYQEQVSDLLTRLPGDEAATGYRRYLESVPVDSTHQGYFSVDKRTGRDINPDVKAAGDEKGQSADTDAYDLILRDSERLLSLSEPVRFVFSHSALREGWDNPNVFVLGMLKRSDSTVSRRQEIGRGLRLSVNSDGERTDDPLTVHEINELTVVTDESYTDFVGGLQREIGETAGSRPPAPADGRKASGKPPGAAPLRTGRDGASPGLPVAFDPAELVRRCARTIDVCLRVAAPQYLVHHGEQRAADDRDSPGFTVASTSTHAVTAPAASRVRYDLVGEIAGRTQLTRRTASAVLRGISPGTFENYQRNPDAFIAECARLINMEKAAISGR